MIRETQATIGALEFTRSFEDGSPDGGLIQWRAKTGMGQFRDGDLLSAIARLFPKETVVVPGEEVGPEPEPEPQGGCLSCELLRSGLNFATTLIEDLRVLIVKAVGRPVPNEADELKKALNSVDEQLAGVHLAFAQAKTAERELQEINTILNEQLAQAHAELARLSAGLVQDRSSIPVLGTIGDGDHGSASWNADPADAPMPTEDEVNAAVEAVAHTTEKADGGQDGAAS